MGGVRHLVNVTVDSSSSDAPPRANRLAPVRATSALVVAARVVLLLLAVAATVSAFGLRGGHSDSSRSSDRYVCPMHPEVTSGTPDECPICHMELEQVARSEPGGTATAASAPALSRHADSVDHGSAEQARYVCPMHPDVTADKPGKCSRCGMPLEPVQKSKPRGSAADVSATFSLAGSASLKDFKVIGTVKRRLLTSEVRAPAWVETEGRIIAVLRKDELIGLSREERALFFRATAPNEGLAVELTVDPPSARDGSTVQVQLRPDSTAPKLQAGETGWVELAARSRDLLLVPTGAVLYSSRGPYVLVAGADDRTFSTRHVEIGSVSRGLVVILSGLHDGERIAVGSAFSLDAERRLASERGAPAGVTP